MSFLDNFRVDCSQCPWDSGDIYQRDCCFPDCAPYIWQHLWHRFVSEIKWQYSRLKQWKKSFG